MQKDLEFIANEFIYREVPREQAYLLKYFRTDKAQAFLRYYLAFGTYKGYREITGFAIGTSMLMFYVHNFHELTELHARAKADMDMGLLWSIESGEYRFKLYWPSHLTNKRGKNGNEHPDQIRRYNKTKR